MSYDKPRNWYAIESGPFDTKRYGTRERQRAHDDIEEGLEEYEAEKRQVRERKTGIRNRPLR